MLAMATALCVSCNNDKEATSAFNYNDEKFADIQMLRYEVKGFDALTLDQKKLVYYLQEAALHGRDILFDQNGRHNLVIRKMLETVYTDYQGDKTTEDWTFGRQAGTQKSVKSAKSAKPQERGGKPQGKTQGKSAYGKTAASNRQGKPAGKGKPTAHHKKTR